MKTYRTCPPAVHERVSALISKYFQAFKVLGLQIDLLFVATDGDAAALTLHGYPCQAVVRKTNAKERAAGRGDAEIVIDEANWIALTPRQQDALLHHELHHLFPVLDGKGRNKVDSAGRPVLQIRKHDHQLGWFDDVARIYGDDSIEIRSARALIADAGQIYFEFAHMHAEPARATA